MTRRRRSRACRLRQRTFLTILLLLPALAPAQQLELPRTAARMAEIAEDPSSAAQLVVVVDAQGRSRVLTSGHCDAAHERPFEDWMPVPLGRLSTVFARAAFRRACERGAVAPDQPIGDRVEGLPPDVAKLRWREVLGAGGGGLPGYLRFVPPEAQPRPLVEILRAHAFLPTPEDARREPDSMTPWALLQAALERELGEPWPELLRKTAAEAFEMSGVRDERTLAEHLIVARQLADGTPTGTWWSEVPAAQGATASGGDLVHLLRRVHDAKFRQELLPEWTDAWDLDLRGAAGLLRYYADPGLAVFAFVARQGDAAAALHEAVLADVLPAGGGVLLVDEPIRLAAGLFDDVRTTGGRWRGTLMHLERVVPIEVTAGLHPPIGLCPPVRLRVGEDERFRLLASVFLGGRAVYGEFMATGIAPDGCGQHVRLNVRLSDGALVGYAVLRAFHPALGEVERLPCPVRLERVER